MNTCPHCSRPAISKTGKAMLGPAISAHCQHCGRRVSIPPQALLAAIPFLASIMCSAWLAPEHWLLSLASLAAGAVIMFGMHEALVPLVVSD